MSVCDFGEIVAIESRHVRSVLRTLADDFAFAQPQLRRAAADLADATEGQDQDRDAAWLLPAEPLWTLAFWADALRVYGLDETRAASYGHPAVVAQLSVMDEITRQAPRTAAAMDAVDRAEVICILADQHNER